MNASSDNRSGPASGNGKLDWKVKADAFHARMDKAKYTMDFNTSMEAIMSDTSAAPRERVLAWIKRKSWGNLDELAIDRVGGRPLRQMDCAEELKLSRPHISRAITLLVRRGLVPRGRPASASCRA